MAYSVAERAQEFGIRAALGATPGNVRWLVLRQSAKLAISGLIAGVLAFLGLGRLLSGFLFGVKPGDPGVYAAVVLVLTFVVLLASYLPAYRLTWLRKNRVHADLERFWMGHETETVGDGYSKMKEDVAFRLEQAAKVGLGFELPPKITDAVRIVRKNEAKLEVENAA